MNFLQQILNDKRDEIRSTKTRRPEGALQAQIATRSGPRSLYRALRENTAPGIIAEIKRASPSAGQINAGVDPLSLATTYEKSGAAAISVLTDGTHFQGSLADLQQVRSRVTLPVLRKDFILDPYQILEAAAAGADAVLLIVAALSPAQLRELNLAAAELQLEILVEIHNEAELYEALACEPRLIGINNRDLTTFKIDLGVSERLIPRVPAPISCIAESGIVASADVERMADAGAHGVLVGTHLMTAPDPGKALQELRRGVRTC